jgi:hypothetical protein
MEHGWVKFLQGELTDEEGNELWRRTSMMLESFLSTHSDGAEHLLGVIAKQLAGKEDASTWGKLRDCLTNYFGEDGAFLIGWLADAETDVRLESFAAVAASSVVDLTRRVISMYGSEIRLAISAYQEFPDDWRRIRGNVYYDYGDRSWLLKVRLEKYNGQEVVVDATPDSAMNLTTRLLEMLTMVSDRSVFNPERARDIRQAMQELQQMLAPAPEAIADAAASQVAPDQPQTPRHGRSAGGIVKARSTPSRRLKRGRTHR